MSSAQLRSIGSVVAAVFGSLATANTFPQYTAVFAAVAGLLTGWLHLEKPQPKADK